MLVANTDCKIGFLCIVQLRGPHSGSPGDDSEGYRDVHRVQDHGQGRRQHAGQEKGTQHLFISGS